MWNTSEGDRILQGKESALFRAGVLSLVERVKEEADFQSDGYGIAVFDELTWSQRLAVLETISTSLLKKSAPPPKLSAVNESAIAMVFEQICFEIDIEIDSAMSSDAEERLSATRWRELALNAAHERIWNLDKDGEETCELDDDFIPESSASLQRDLWHPLVRSLADQILWDRDFEMMETFVDEPPEKATMMRQIMGIDEDYFSTAAEDLYSTQQVENAIERLHQVLSPS